MYHFLYKTTNNLTGQYYYGVHSTKNIDDRYLGSGIRLKNNIGKYGRANFTRTIIRVFASGREALRAEADLINTEMLLDPLCLNLTMGGQGQPRMAEGAVCDKISETAKLRGIKPSRNAIMKSADRRRGVALSPEHREKIRQASLHRSHTPEEIDKIKKSLKLYHENNTPHWIGFSQSDLQKSRAREAMHRRWHTSRSIVSPSCEFCVTPLSA